MTQDITALSAAAQLSADLQQHSLEQLYEMACKEDDKVKQALGQRFSKTNVICAIIENFGVRSQVCKVLDCTRAQLARYISIHPDLVAVEKSARDMLMDKCESVLVKNLDSGSEMTQMRAAEILMKTVGAKKYGQAGVAVEVDNGKDTKVKIQQIFGLD